MQLNPFSVGACQHLSSVFNEQPVIFLTMSEPGQGHRFNYDPKRKFHGPMELVNISIETADLSSVFIMTNGLHAIVTLFRWTYCTQLADLAECCPR